jgi:predicted nucleic acid-binding protein
VSEEKKALKEYVSKKQAARKSGVEFPDAYVSTLAEEHECGEIATFNISDFKKLNAKLYPL